jgi:hypothetical protein
MLHFLYDVHGDDSDDVPLSSRTSSELLPLSRREFPEVPDECDVS